jgi:hypothetical protein
MTECCLKKGEERPSNPVPQNSLVYWYDILLVVVAKQILNIKK